ncbi:Uncharacterised protein [Mycobacteroides abscessus subsp. abscessus]|nr:Uncharacterised protein [Mycobacteroides abscessus subsp. abscessus]
MAPNAPTGLVRRMFGQIEYRCRRIAESMQEVSA